MSREQYMEAVVPLASMFVEAIHGAGPDVASDVVHALDAIPRPPGVPALLALATVLAAAVDPTTSITGRLDWVRPLTPTPTAAQIPPVNPFAVELALSGYLTAAQLTEEQARAACTELALHRGWTPTQITAHLDADPTDVTRWIMTARSRSRRKRPA